MIQPEEIAAIKAALLRDHNPRAIALASMANAVMRFMPPEFGPIVPAFTACIAARAKELDIPYDALMAALKDCQRANETLSELMRIPD